MSKKIFKKNKLLLHNDDKLLLREHFDIKNNKIKTSKKKGVLNHSIPCIFCKYNKRNSFVEIQAKCDYHNKIKKNKNYLCEPGLLLEVDESVLNFYLKQYNEK